MHTTNLTDICHFPFGKTDNYQALSAKNHADIGLSTVLLSHRKITAADKGKGVVTERGYDDVDGMITNESKPVPCYSYLAFVYMIHGFHIFSHSQPY